MKQKITNDIYADYLNCPYKAYLKVTGKNGRKTKFELMQDELSKEYKVSTFRFLQDEWKNEAIISDLSLSEFREKNYTRGINIRGKSKRFDVNFDSIIKEANASVNLLPILFINKENLSINDRLKLAFCGFALGIVLSEMPSFGRVIYGSNHSKVRVKLDKLIARTRPAVEDIDSFINTHDPPQMHINKNCHICEFENDCLKTTMDNDDLSLIRGLGVKEIKKLHNKGIFTVNQLSYTFRPRRKRKTNRSRLKPFNPALKALALRENKVHVFEAPNLPRSDIEIYLDVENLPNRNFYYLIGMLVNDQGMVSEYSFWADQQDQQCNIFRNLLAVLDKYDEYTLYHFGQFEKRYLKKMLKNIERNEKKNTEAIIDRCCNILSYLYSNIYFPTYSNGLKDVAGYLGYKWREVEASGIQSIIWREEWEKTRSYQIKNKLIEYNLDDCYALKTVKDFVFSINESKDHTLSLDGDIVYQHQLKSSSPFKFLTGEYADPAIERLHKYSLFDYQRQRVFVRTDDFIKKSEKRKIRKKKSILRPNKSIASTARICVRCKSRNINSLKEISKNIIDLKFTKSGVKRWVTRFSSFIYQCKECGLLFSPERYKLGLDKFVPRGCRKNRSKYGHNIKCWTTYQHIVNDLSFRKIESELYALFTLAIGKSSLHEFKSYIQKYYHLTYEILLKKVLHSNILYIDETPLKMRNEDGYAWVLTNNRETVSIYNPTREGDFLKDLLKNFDGILVSDFYAAYDSIDCIQQKCLIHLIRDMNDDLLKNPFNEELKFITQKFTGLMQRIVRTIDRFGLKKYYLQKYNKNVERFIGQIANFRFQSEIGLYYQERLNRNKDKLFTFINYDNVSWNNINAEKSIKLLATHTNRKIKLFSEDRMREYLQIMSIYQTCVYNNVSFLKFLLSKERDVGKYIEAFFS